jgi:hypothetical protein
LIALEQCSLPTALCLLFVFEILGSDYGCFPCAIPLTALSSLRDLEYGACMRHRFIELFCNFEATVGDASEDTVKLRSGVLVAYLL